MCIRVCISFFFIYIYVLYEHIHTDLHIYLHASMCMLFSWADMASCASRAITRCSEVLSAPESNGEMHEAQASPSIPNICFRATVTNLYFCYFQLLGADKVSEQALLPHLTFLHHSRRHASTKNTRTSTFVVCVCVCALHTHKT